MPNPIMHVEIVGDDPAGLVDFYRSAFDWTLRELPTLPDFCHLRTGHENNIACGIGPVVGDEQRVRFYAVVDDLEAKLAELEELGATVIVQPWAIPDGPRVAQVTDPEGNMVGVVTYNPPRETV